MIRWVVVIFIGLIVFPALLPWMRRLGIWHVPGDVRFKVAGMLWCLPFGSTVVVSALAFLIAQVLQ
ncbi:MAG TPA: DUF2905 domain-containing protein [Burkholderiaceae bacterium]|nr:DUF2905 domain-containing protein [Burkholderiaceae bacterium]